MSYDTFKNCSKYSEYGHHNRIKRTFLRINLKSEKDCKTNR